MAKKNKVPDTSVEAYKSLNPAKLAKTYRGIILALTKISSGHFEDIAYQMKVEPDVVWKRLSELNKAGIIRRSGYKKILKSGRMGYMWELTTKGMPKTDKDMKALKDKPTISDYSRNIETISKQAKQQNLF